MPPRYVFWTIIIDGQPTAFRAADQADLLPTLRQLQGRNPDAVMRWFARGRLWASPEEARAARTRPAPVAGDRRGRDWRPGGTHKDPRDRPRKESFQAQRRREKKAAALARSGAPPAPRRPSAKQVASMKEPPSPRVLPPLQEEPPGRIPAGGPPAPPHKTRPPRLRKGR